MFYSLNGKIYIGIRRGGGMVYTQDLKSCACKGVRVRVPPAAHIAVD